MAARHGYGVDVVGPGGLVEFMALLRQDAMRVFARLWSAILADEVARRVDGHRSGLLPGLPGGSPMMDAIRHLRSAYADAEPDSPLRALDLRLRLWPIETGLLVQFESGHDGYRGSLANLAGLRDLSLPDPRSEGIDEAALSARAAVWDAALSGPPMGRGLGFRLVEEGLPSVRHAALRRSFPSHEARCLRTAQAFALARGASGDPAREAVDREVRRLARVLPRAIEEEDTRAYPAPRPAAPPARGPARQRPVERPAPDAPQLIDHADIIEGSDGRVFLAVPDAGLDPEERVHLQVADRYLSFVQGTTHFGGVTDVPYAAIELLRRCRVAYVVEVRKVDGRREIRARHEALVRDDTLPDVYRLAMSGFRTSAARARRRANVQWMEG